MARVRLRGIFIYSVLFILAGAAILKLLSTGQNTPALDHEYRLLPAISLRQFFLGTAILECAIGFAIWRVRNTDLALDLIIWCSSVFVGFRAIVYFYGNGAPCGCMGTFFVKYGESVAAWLLAWMLLGSLALRLSSRFLPATASNDVIQSTL